MTRLGAFVSGLTAWRRLAFAFAMGAVSATGFAPLQFFPALLIGHAALVLLIDGAVAGPKPVRRAATAGWAFCFGQFLVGWHWIGFAFLVDAADHLWQMPFALLSLTAGVALYGALAGGVAAFFWRPGSSSRLFVFAICFAVVEWLRGHLFTGFPWNLSAYGWGASLELLQSASLMGAYGLSFLTILLGAALAEFACGRWRAPVAMAVLFATLWCYGVYRLANTPMLDVPGVSVRLVQPDIPQAEKYVSGLMLRNWQRLVDLSARPGRPSIIVWPEAATGFPVERSQGALDVIGLFTARGQTVITGSDRIVRGRPHPVYYNSLYVFGPRGALPEIYDKFHLVPFGEYVPFAPMLNRIGIRQLTVGEGFSSGDHPHVLQVAGAPPMTPLICYEVIFPHDVSDPGGPRPGWFVNITDDSWFGPWAGPRQHFLIARVRAIEEGLPILRDANSGITAVIDGNGRVRKMLGLNRLGIIDANLPAALQPTPYVRFGDLVFLIFLLVAASACFFRSRINLPAAN
jgi:apolipoprotein N-acyltransferase